jgi:primase-polymerase (primpol)-like protein
VLQAVKTAEIEIYSCGRYMACTGLAIQPQEPQEQQEQIDRLYQWLVAKRDKSKTSTVNSSSNRYIPPRQHTSPISSSLSVQDVIQKACNSKGGSEFEQLLNGNWQALNIGDHSQSCADQSFANRLCFWCGGDTQLMYEIFRASGMFRTPRKAWLAINTACKSCGSTYQPTKRKR